uniref:E3 ubiquitin-protein ligase listerin HEAT repeat region domain-containing protein n=1 Tax=Hucho hucho TaxID=62062 RepID=A0A4W5KP74_9TELE
MRIELTTSLFGKPGNYRVITPSLGLFPLALPLTYEQTLVGSYLHHNPQALFAKISLCLCFLMMCVSVCRSPPAALMTLLSTCEELCESIMLGVCVGEFAVVQPLSVEYSCILAYLLAWKLLLSFFKASPSHAKHKRKYTTDKKTFKFLLMAT